MQEFINTPKPIYQSTVKNGVKSQFTTKNRLIVLAFMNLI